MLPLITKERTQKFDLLLHLIPNLKQHLIVSGASGIGKTLLLDRLYDIDSEVWQCCFVQGSAELSFETIEAQLTKTMLRNKHVSLESAFVDFNELHKKVVLIIDDAGFLVSGLMTTLLDYATTQPALRLIFSFTPETRKNYFKTDKALDDCYLLEIPPLNKLQCAYFLRHLAEKPRTYSPIQIDEKLVDKIYRNTHGIPARIIADFTKLSRQNRNDYSKWIAAFIGLIIVAIAINQGLRSFKKESTVEEATILPVEKVEVVEKASPQPEITPVPTEAQLKTEPQDIIIPEFKLDIEKGIVPATVEKSVEPAAKAEPEKMVEPVINSPAEKIPEPTPTTIEPEKSVVPPAMTFPNVKPAKGMKIQVLSEKATIEATPIPAPEVKAVKKIEPVKKVEIKPIEKPTEVKKPESPKVETVKKVELKTAEKKVEKAEVLAPPSTGRYVLQLITLSNQAAVEAFQKKYSTLKDTRIVKSGSEGQERFSLIYGGFANVEEATKARGLLPSEFANALPRKN